MRARHTLSLLRPAFYLTPVLAFLLIFTRVGIASAQPDLQISDLDQSNLVYDHQTLQVYGVLGLTIENSGSTTAPAGFSVQASEKSGNVSSLLGEVNFSAALLPTETRNISVPLSGEVLFAGSIIEAEVDAGRVVAESDEGNNLIDTGSRSELSSVEDSFDMVLEWSWEGSETVPGFRQVMQVPLVASLTDDNGDGLIDEDDVPDVVFTAFGSGNSWFRGGALFALDGATGEEIFAIDPRDYSLSAVGSPAIGDIDGDNMVEIVANQGSRLAVFEHDGTFKFFSEEFPVTGSVHGNVAIADMDSDGSPELIVGGVVFDNQGQALVSVPYPSNNSASFAVDLDLDGELELIAGSIALRNDGSEVFNLNQSFSSNSGVYSGVGNFDSDPNPEIVVRAVNRLLILNHDGSILRELGNITHWVGPPTIADLDGDGSLEIAMVRRFGFEVYNSDLSLRWRLDIAESSGQSFISAFDFNGDGKLELVQNDEAFLRIFDGDTGTILSEIENTSNTLMEGPVIVDVDLDGGAEIVTTGTLWQSDRTGVFVFGSKSNSWPSARPIWNQHAYHVTNVNDDGTIPRVQERNWLNPELNNFRTNIATAGSRFLTSDLSASKLSSLCRSGRSLDVIVGNGGGRAVPSGVVVEFRHYETNELIGSTATSTSLEPGQFEEVSLPLSNTWAERLSEETPVAVIVDGLLPLER